MEKERYTKPQMDIVIFETDDIITSSSGSGNGGEIELPDLDLDLFLLP